MRHTKFQWRCYKGRNWMLQVDGCIGLVNFGVHASYRSELLKYIDFHFPYCILTIGNCHDVEYPPEWWACSRDYRTGVKYNK